MIKGESLDLRLSAIDHALQGGSWPLGMLFPSLPPHLPSHLFIEFNGHAVTQGSLHDAMMLKAALKGHAHVLPRAESRDQQGAGGHVRLYLLFLSGCVSDGLSQTVTAGQGRYQLCAHAAC